MVEIGADSRLRVGRDLREERERRKVSLEEVAKATRFSMRHLQSLEADLFDELPRLKLIIGHDGEMLPFMLERTLPISKLWGQRQRDLLTVWKENIWVTTSAMFSLAPLACLLRVSEVDKIMYSVDYPFSMNGLGTEFLGKIKEEGIMTDEQLDMFAYGNAKKLLFK